MATAGGNGIPHVTSSEAMVVAEDGTVELMDGLRPFHHRKPPALLPVLDSGVGRGFGHGISGSRESHDDRGLGA